MNQLLSASLAPSTINSYRRILHHFISFHCDKYPATVIFPVSQKTLSEYIVHLFNHNMSASTIYSYISAISFVHKLENMTDPTTSFFVKKLLKGVHNTKRSYDCRLPITQSILEQLCLATDKVVFPFQKALLCRSMFLLAFHAFLRIGEFTVNHNNTQDSILQVQDISFQRNSQSQSLSSMTVKISNFKHSDLKPFLIEISSGSSEFLCPVYTLHQYLQLFRHKDGPLFQFLDSSTVTYSYFCKVLQSVLKFIKLDPSVYKGHSFRIGAATSAAARGVPEHIIQKMGRWKSDAVKHYVRIGTHPNPTQ